MNARLVAAAVVVLTTCCAAACAAPSAEVVARVTIPGPAHWNYLHVDSQGHRLYLAHGSQIEVIDTHSNQLVGTVADTPGVRAIDIAADLGLGYASNGKDDSVTVFDLATLAHKATIAAGSSPDAIVYDRTHQRVLVFNTRSHDITVIDAKAGRVLATVAAGGEPETAVLGADGLVYFNVEDTHELVVFDPDAMVVVRRHSLRPCERPTGLAIDSEGSFYSVCRNGVMVVSGADGRPVGVATIGHGSDGVVVMGGLAYSADGAEGALSVVGRNASGGYETVAQVPTAYGSRTLAADPASRRLYLPTASFKPAEGGMRRQPIPETLSIWVLEPR
jgi:YVTN family beta-propeller protein